MSEKHFDIIVIGSGPGGEGAAMQASKLGKSVGLIERDPPIGGGCTHKGTIPSKALRNAIFQATSAFNNKIFRDTGILKLPEFPDLRKSAAAVIEKQVDMRMGFYERNDVDVYNGHASFVDASTISVTDAYGGKRSLSADAYVIAKLI